jgi:putative acetyltransferase
MSLTIARLGPDPPPDALRAVAALFDSYRSALYDLGVPIDSFQGFSEEIASLPGKYAEGAGGCLLLGLESEPLDATAPPSAGGGGGVLSVVDADTGARCVGVPVACIALRALPGLDATDGAGHATAEVKRLFVHPSRRGCGYGRRVSERAVSVAVQCGYTRLVLDTLGRMPDAVALYTRDLGFSPVGPYCANPMPDALYMARQLAAPSLPPPAARAAVGAAAGGGRGAPAQPQ